MAYSPSPQAKAYAKAHGTPRTWDEDDQGFLSRKYDMYTKGSHDDDLQNKINNTILGCFICSNCFLLFVMLICSKTLYSKASSFANSSGSTRHKQSMCKGVVVVTAYLLVPIYIIGLFIAHTNGTYPKYYRPCSVNYYYNCTPPVSSILYKQQVTTFYSKVGLIVFSIFSYFITATVTVKTVSIAHILFRSRYCRWMEAYILCATLLGIHICVGLAGVPILIFFIITPTYTFFYVSAFALLIILLSLPVALLFHSCHPTVRVVCRISNRWRWSFHCLKLFVAYVVSTTFIILLVYLYYGLLKGGASMNGTKGILFSLLPPAVVSVSAFMIRRKFLTQKNNEDKTSDSESERIIKKSIQDA